MSDELFEDLNVYPTVCTAHMRFVPCRKGPKGCKITNEEAMVELVVRYQRNTGTRDD